MDEIEKRGTIQEGEYHPAANSALAYVNALRLNIPAWLMFKEALASTALAGSRMAEILLSTVDRLDRGGMVSDRYLLGLAWYIKNNEKELL